MFLYVWNIRNFHHIINQAIWYFVRIHKGKNSIWIYCLVTVASLLLKWWNCLIWVSICFISNKTGSRSMFMFVILAFTMATSFCHWKLKEKCAHTECCTFYVGNSKLSLIFETPSSISLISLLSFSSMKILNFRIYKFGY